MTMLEQTDENGEVEIIDSVLLLNLSQTYRDWMTEEEVLAVASVAWGVDKKKKDRAQYALAIYEHEVKGVFKILSWSKDEFEADRWGFEGEIAPPQIKDRYLGKKVMAWAQGQRAPFIYINC